MTKDKRALVGGIYLILSLLKIKNLHRVIWRGETKMLFRIVIYIVGFTLLCIGTIHCAVFLNLIPSGFTVTEYFQFIFRHTETYGIPIGAILIQLSATMKKKAD